MPRGSVSRPVGWAWLAIVALLLAAAVVRIHDIGAQDIWADEGFTYFATQTSDLVGLLRSDVHPPLYFGALRLWADVAGTSELALRLPSALAGLLTVALVFRLALDLSVMQAPRQAAVFAGLAALMMVLSDLEVDLSQEARMYTVQSALSVAAVIAYVRWLKRGRRGMLVVLAVCSAALVYVNYLGAWIPVTIGLHAVLTMRPRRAIPLVAALIAAAAAAAPWLLAVGVQQVGNGAGADRADPATWDTLLRYRDIWFGQMWPLTVGLLGVGAIAWLQPSRRPGATDWRAADSVDRAAAGADVDRDELRASARRTSDFTRDARHCAPDRAGIDAVSGRRAHVYRGDVGCVGRDVGRLLPDQGAVGAVCRHGGVVRPARRTGAHGDRRRGFHAGVLLRSRAASRH